MSVVIQIKVFYSYCVMSIADILPAFRLKVKFKSRLSIRAFSQAHRSRNTFPPSWTREGIFYSLRARHWEYMGFIFSLPAYLAFGSSSDVVFGMTSEDEQVFRKRIRGYYSLC